MKRFAALALIVAVLATFLVAAAPVSAAAPVAIIRFNGHPVFFDVEPVIENGRTLVPFRAILEAMGAKVSFNATTQTVTADRFGTKVELVLGSSRAMINGRATTIPDGVVAKSIKGRTMIPLRFISESMGLTVRWDAQQRIANILDSKWPARGGTLQMAIWSAPDDVFNPILYETSYDYDVIGWVYQGLYNLDAAGNPYGDLARYWTVSPDNLTMTFHLDKGARFHDGTPVTAEDVKFTYESIMHPNYKGVRDKFDYLVGHDEFKAGNAREVTGIKVVDANTVSFTTKVPYAPFFWDLSFGILPKHLYGRTDVGLWTTPRDPMAKKPVGSGPYKFVSYQPGQFYMLEAFEGYNLGRPYIDRVVIKVLSQETALAQLQVSAIDSAEIKVSDIPTVQKMSHLSLTETPQFVWQYLGFNTLAEPVNDKQVRQAIAYAVDADAIVSQLLEGHGGRMYHAIYPLNWAYTEEGINKYDYSPAKAEATLQAAGWRKGSDGIYAKDGKKLALELLYPTGNVVRMNSAPLIKSWLEAVGMQVTLTRMDVGSMFDKVETTDEGWQMFLGGWAGGIGDPDPRDIWSKAQLGLFNFYNWWTPKSEDLMDRAVKTLDLDQRRALYAQWSVHFTDELPVYPLYMANAVVATNKRIKNLKASPVGTFWNVYELYIEG